MDRSFTKCSLNDPFSNVDILMKTSPLKTKKRQDGSIYMVMFSVSRNKNLFLQQSLDLDLSFLPCKSFPCSVLCYNPIYVVVILTSYKWFSFNSAIFIFLLAIVGVFYPYNRGALFTALVVIYALTSGIAGYTATSFYLQLEGTNWVRHALKVGFFNSLLLYLTIIAVMFQVRNLILTGCLFCGPLFLTFSFLNTVAIAYSATAALPFGTIIVIILIWALVTSPLLVLGGIAGKNSNTEFQSPCRTTKYPREIPQLPWYRSTIPQMAMAGFLPFSAIYIELYYIFASIWGHKIYTIYSILFIVFIILIIVTAFVTVALTYFQLAVEDHKWWWRSVFRTSIYLVYPHL